MTCRGACGTHGAKSHLGFATVGKGRRAGTPRIGRPLRCRNGCGRRAWGGTYGAAISTLVLIPLASLGQYSAADPPLNGRELAAVVSSAYGSLRALEVRARAEVWFPSGEPQLYTSPRWQANRRVGQVKEGVAAMEYEYRILRGQALRYRCSEPGRTGSCALHFPGGGVRRDYDDGSDQGLPGFRGFLNVGQVRFADRTVGVGYLSQGDTIAQLPFRLFLDPRLGRVLPASTPASVTDGVDHGRSCKVLGWDLRRSILRDELC